MAYNTIITFTLTFADPELLTVPVMMVSSNKNFCWPRVPYYLVEMVSVNFTVLVNLMALLIFVHRNDAWRTLREKLNIRAQIRSNTDRRTPRIPQCSDVFDHVDVQLTRNTPGVFY